MPLICGLPSLGFLFGLLLLAAAIEGIVRLFLDDILGWQLPPNTPPDQAAEFERRKRLVAVVLSIGLGIAVCWAFGIGILRWLNLGLPNVPPEATSVVDYVFTGLVIGGGTRAVAALLRGVGFLPATRPAPTAAADPADPLSATEPTRDMLAQNMRVDELPGFLWKTLLVPPNYVGLLYSRGVPTASLPPGKHIVRWIGAREPTMAALVDVNEFGTNPVSAHQVTADGEPLDCKFHLRARVADPLRFGARVLDCQPLVDRRTVANLLVAELNPSIQGAVAGYDAGSLFDNPAARANLLRRLTPPLSEFCTDHGLEQKEFTSLDFEAAVDPAQAIAQLESYQNEDGKKEIARQAESGASGEQVIKQLEEKTGISHLLTPQEEQEVKQSLAAPGGQARGIPVIERAVDRKLSELERRVEDEIEQSSVRDRDQTKLDEFFQKNVGLLTFADKLKMFAGLLISALTVAGIAAPDRIPNRNIVELSAAGLGLLGGVLALIGSAWLSSEFGKRKSQFQNGWLNRLSAERVLDSDACLRAQAEKELAKVTEQWRESRNRLVGQRKEAAIRLKEIEERANRLRQQILGAETGGLILKTGHRVSARQAQRLIDLDHQVLRSAEDLSRQGAALRDAAAQANWAVADEIILASDTALSALRDCFANRATILHGQ